MASAVHIVSHALQPIVLDPLGTSALASPYHSSSALVSAACALPPAQPVGAAA